MGSFATASDLGLTETTDGDDDLPLGDLLAGRLSDIDVDSVAAVRDIRENV